MAHSGETFDRNTFIHKLCGLVHLSHYVFPQKNLQQKRAPTQNVYNQNVKKINTYVLQSSQIVFKNKRPNPRKSIINRL